MIMLRENSNIDNDTKKRLKKLFFVYLIIASLMLGYLLVFIYLPFLKIPCVFNLITGLNCPGCGISRMLHSFVTLKIWKGIEYNYFLGFTFPYLIALIIYCSYNFVTRKKIKIFEVSMIVYLVLFIVWGIIRNIIGI